jgi:hypothetical protein
VWLAASAASAAAAAAALWACAACSCCSLRRAARRAAKARRARVGLRLSGAGMEMLSAVEDGGAEGTSGAMRMEEWFCREETVLVIRCLLCTKWSAEFKR